MPMSRDLGVIDLMLSIPDADASRWYKFLQAQLRDRESRGLKTMGLSLERIFRELPDVPFRDHVWPKFLRENAIRVFALDDPVWADRHPRGVDALGLTGRGDGPGPGGSGSPRPLCLPPSRRRSTLR